MLRISVVEGRLAHEEDPGDDTDSPDVNLIVILDLSAELRGHVEWASQRQRLLLGSIILCSESKVRQFDVNLIAGRI